MDCAEFHTERTWIFRSFSRAVSGLPSRVNMSAADFILWSFYFSVTRICLLWFCSIFVTFYSFIFCLTRTAPSGTKETDLCTSSFGNLNTNAVFQVKTHGSSNSTTRTQHCSTSFVSHSLSRMGCYPVSAWLRQIYYSMNAFYLSLCLLLRCVIKKHIKLDVKVSVYPYSVKIDLVYKDLIVNKQ